MAASSSVERDASARWATVRRTLGPAPSSQRPTRRRRSNRPSTGSAKRRGARASWCHSGLRASAPVPLHVEQAQTRSGEGPPFKVTLGDARHLEVEDESVDAVLLMGPLYHLVEAAERHVALLEARRVLRHTGVLVATAIGRFAWLFDAVVRDLIVSPPVVASVTASVTSGISNPDPGDSSFYAYLHRPEELQRELVGAGFQDVTIHAIEGFGHLLADINQRMGDPERRSALLSLIDRYGQEPAIVGISGHVLAVARPAQPTAVG